MWSRSLRITRRLGAVFQPSVRFSSNQLKDFYRTVAPDNLRPGGQKAFVGPEGFYEAETQRVKEMSEGWGEHTVSRGFGLTQEGMIAAMPISRNFPPSRKLIDDVDVVIVGGGTAGMAVAKQLGRRGVGSLIIDPSEYHFYQPLWTLVGAGHRKIDESKQRMLELVHDRSAGVFPNASPLLLQTSVVEFAPEQNALFTADGRKVVYKQLIVAAGLEVKIDKIKGLRESLGRGGVCSNYVYPYAERTWDFVKYFPGGNAIFTHPAGPIKCGGGPQKIMYAAEAHWRTYVGRDRFKVIFNSGQPKQFHVPYYEKSLKAHCEEKGIKDINLGLDLIEIKAEEKKAVFKRVLDSADGTKKVGDIEVFDYTFLHVTPPQGPLGFLANSPLVDAAGWVDVDKSTLQSKKYPNIFGLGDCANLPTSKTAAAAAAQSVIVVENIIRQQHSKVDNKPFATYDGYTACPFILGYGKGMMAEFDYTLQPAETFPVDQSKPSRWAFYMKEQFFPAYYWEGPMKGRWLAPQLRTLFKSSFNWLKSTASNLQKKASA